MNKAIVFFAALLLLLCGGMAIWAGWKYSQPSQSPSEMNVEPILKDFTLTDRSGKKVRWKDLDGQVRVVNFFYSACPSTCRQQTRRMEELVKEFGPKNVRFVSITCDPDTDTPEVLAEYARGFHSPPSQWHFLTGELAYLRRVGTEMFQVPYEKLTHSENLIVVDRWGKVRMLCHWNDAQQVAQAKHKLSLLLAETSPPPEEPPKVPQDADDDGLID